MKKTILLRTFLCFLAMSSLLVNAQTVLFHHVVGCKNLVLPPSGGRTKVGKDDLLCKLLTTTIYNYEANLSFQRNDKCTYSL